MHRKLAALATAAVIAGTGVSATTAVTASHAPAAVKQQEVRSSWSGPKQLVRSSWSWHT